jgi:CheY-like chemotaxis protein
MLLVAVTGWGQREDRQLAADAGFDHHLTKPVDFGRLSALVGSTSAPTFLPKLSRGATGVSAAS